MAPAQGWASGSASGFLRYRDTVLPYGESAVRHAAPANDRDGAEHSSDGGASH